MLAELDGSDAVVRKYTWGLDLAGLSGQSPERERAGLESAGGISGLLAVHDATVSGGEDYVFTYDANGNVGQVLDLGAATVNDAIVAHYEYDPYGNVVAQSGVYADENPWRFSTKYWDDETGLGYWGYRYYSPRLGRWMSRDLLREFGGFDLYMYAHNSPAAAFDALGLYVERGASPGQAPKASTNICPKGWELHEGGDLADERSGSGWRREGFIRGEPGSDRIWALFSRTSTYWKKLPVKGNTGGCGQAVQGSVSIAWSESIAKSGSIQLGVSIFRIVNINVQGGVAKTKGVAFTTTDSWGPYQKDCYRFMVVPIGQWQDVFAKEEPVDPYIILPPPATDWSSANFVGGGWTSRLGHVVCKKRCCASNETTSD